METLAIRFTNDIYRDIEKGNSSYFNGSQDLDGICAWNIIGADSYSSQEEIKEAAERTAKMIAANTYGGYSSSNEYAIIRGKYIGNGNDGILLQDVEVISVESL
jgi:hypothetical protein